MSVFQTAYQTSACAGTNLSKLTEALIRARVEGYIHPMTGYSDVFLVRRDRTVDEMVPSFEHPVVSEASGHPVVYADVRSYGKLSLTDFSFEVTNQDGYDAATLRARLQQIWSNGGQNSLRSMRLPAMAFTQWVSSNITKRLSLGPAEQAKLSILAGIYYLSLFRDKAGDGKDDKTAVISQVAKNTGIKPAIVEEVVDRVHYISDINDFCDVVKDEIKNVRLNNLNIATLFPIMGGSWYGANAAQNVAVALEHPPTWIMMIYQAVTARSFYHSGLAKMLEQNQYKNEARQFIISLREKN
jgi:hypothetical protein